MKLTTSHPTAIAAFQPNVFQRAMAIKTVLGIEQATQRPMFTAPQRIQAETTDWWMYPAELDYALWQHGAIPIRAVHWPTVTRLAGHFDRLFMAHEMPRGAEFVEQLAVAPAGFVPVSKPALFKGVKLAAYAPQVVLPQTYYAPPAARPSVVDLFDPILFGVITDGRTGVFMPIASWTWR